MNLQTLSRNPNPQPNKWLTACAAALFLAGGVLPSEAQTWETFLPLPDTESVGVQVVIDPHSADPANNPAVFIGCADGSIQRMEPLTAAAYRTTPADHSLAQLIRMGYNPADSTLYALGSRPLFTTPPLPRTNPNVWTVRNSSFDSGSQTWKAWTDTGGDLFFLGNKESGAAWGFTTDAAGNAYACGTATLKGVPHWIVRCKLASGNGWTTISDLSSKSSATALDLCYFPGDPSRNLPPALLVAGILNSQWTVRRLENGSWSVADTVSLSGGVNTLACDSQGKIFACGYRAGALAGLGYGWVVRMSTGGGAPGSWIPVVDASEGYFSSAGSVEAGQDGSVWGSGFTGSTMVMQTTQPIWTVVRNSPGQSWMDSWNLRQHQFLGAAQSRARGIATDAYGRVFVTGHVQDWTDGAGNRHAGSRAVLQRLISTP